MDYSRNGFNLDALPVTEFNKAVLNKTLKERAISSSFYMFYNKHGELKKTGWVAFTYNCAYFGKTKKEAIDFYKECNKRDESVFPTKVH